MKLLFPVFRIYPFKNIHTVSNTVTTKHAIANHFYHQVPRTRNFIIYNFGEGEYICYAISHNNSLYIQEDPFRLVFFLYGSFMLPDGPQLKH